MKDTICLKYLEQTYLFRPASLRAIIQPNHLTQAECHRDIRCLQDVRSHKRTRDTKDIPGHKDSQDIRDPQGRWDFRGLTQFTPSACSTTTHLACTALRP
jgi:hypothetical protein